MSSIASQFTTPSSPFHPGERDVQTRAGVRKEAEKRGQRMLTADLNPKQMQFFRQLPFLVSAHTDTHGQPWASLITGQPGFVAIDEDRYHCAVTPPTNGNPNGAKPRVGSNIGLLGIELSSRRRNRLNGTLFSADDGRWRILIEQGYGNCPKYINERPWPAELFAKKYRLEEAVGLSDKARSLVSTTDTFFIATTSGSATPDTDTQSSAWGADISHRGGKPGFLQSEDGQLLFEDFPGNNMFNTLGNIQRYPPCGLLILDFDSGDILQLSARGGIEHRHDGRTVRLDIIGTRYWHAD